MTTLLPKVSCLMLSKNRLPDFGNSLECFSRQTYPHRELVVVSEGPRDYWNSLNTIIEERKVANARVIGVDPGRALGALRNLAVELAEGSIVCQWDDDDLYHPERLRLQVADLLQSGADISYLADQFHLFCDSRRLHWCDWSSASGTFGVVPNTLVAFKSSLPRYIPSLSQHEDSLPARTASIRGQAVSVLKGHGYLYIYCYHGGNSFAREHHESITKLFALPGKALSEQKDRITDWLRDFPISPPIECCGAGDELAFIWQ